LSKLASLGVMAVSPPAISRAARLLREGHLVAFPTETVYGLGADAQNEEAVKKLYEAKGRPLNHPVIVHLPSLDAISEWCMNIPDQAWVLANAFWPGPLTLVLRKSEKAKHFITGGQDTVAVRVPSHPIALALLKEFDGGIVAPSANRFGKLSPTRAEHVASDFGDSIALVLDGGPCQIGIESTIVNLSSGQPEILRPGMITADQIAQKLGISGLDLAPKTKPTVHVPGDLPSHYAPETPLCVVPHSELLDLVKNSAALKYAVLAFDDQPETLSAYRWLKGSNNPKRYAEALYATLRTLDQAGADRILIEAVPTASEWQGIADRLERATQK
jgi:L-threonylcarbamoyladenylate synthase